MNKRAIKSRKELTEYLVGFQLKSKPRIAYRNIEQRFDQLQGEEILNTLWKIKYSDHRSLRAKIKDLFSVGDEFYIIRYCKLWKGRTDTKKV